MLKEARRYGIGESISNKYYLLLANREVLDWDIYHLESLPPHLMWTTYYSKALQIIEQRLAGSGLIFYLTRDELNFLPSYGENVVVIIATDEWCRIPKYAHQVLAIFKSYGVKPFLGCNPLLDPSYLNFASLIQFLRVWIAYLPGLINYGYQTLKNVSSGRIKIPNIYTIPLGYYNQLDTSKKEIDERTYDVFFAGSALNDSYIPGSLKEFLASLLTPPKIQSRKKMIVYLHKFRNKFINFTVELSLTDGFYLMTENDIKTYAERLMNSKICLIPRGTSYETYRFFEAIRFGCIPIVESLPPHWFYKGFSGVKVKNWRNLPEILEDLLSNPDLLESIHKKALYWWQTQCSERAVGEYMVNNLKKIRSR
jgi:Exostosin family